MRQVSRLPSRGQWSNTASVDDPGGYVVSSLLVESLLPWIDSFLLLFGKAPLSEYSVEDFENSVAWWNAGKDQMYHYRLLKSPETSVCVITGVMNISNESEVVISDHTMVDQVGPSSDLRLFIARACCAPLT